MSRSAVYLALFALTASMSKDVGGLLVSRSRKFKHFAAVPKTEQPAFFQTEPHEEQTQKTRMDTIRKWHANWVFYFSSDESDPASIPADTANTIIDQVEAIFAAASHPGDLNVTLGGLAHHIFIDGSIIKIPGDDDGQGMLIIPITLLVP